MSTKAKPSIVFAHGLWADVSCFRKVIPALQAEGHGVMAAQNSLDTLEGDVAAVTRALARVSSPAILDNVERRIIEQHPPVNICFYDDTIFEGLQSLLARIDASSSLRVVVFESANPEFYLAHFDLTGKTGNVTTAVGPSGLPILMDTFVRLTKSPVVSIASEAASGA